MPISWNEIRHNAIQFSREWTGVKSKSAEKQTFWNRFFEVFGIQRRLVAAFEEPVRRIARQRRAAAAPSQPEDLRARHARGRPPCL
jgi:hypothetical protein